MLTDFQGLEVSTSSSETINYINEFLIQELTIGNNTEVILEAIKSDPTCGLANIYAAVSYLFSRSPDSVSQAAQYIDAATRCDMNTREQRTLAAVDAWFKQDIPQAIARSAVPKAIAHHQAIAEVFPQDSINIHICQYHQRNSGDSEGMLQIIKQVLPTNPDSSYLQAMYAYALGECGYPSEAEFFGKRAIIKQLDNRWAHHAVAHALEAQGRFQEGIAWMHSVSDTWEQTTPAFYSHLWWHTALFHLESQQYNIALALYDEHVWGRASKENILSQINAISLLIRLELKSVDVGQRWSEIAPHLEPRLQQRVLGYHDLHYVYALARAGQKDWINQILTSMQEIAKQSLPETGQTWTEIAIPGAQAMVAHAQGDWQTTIALFEPIRPRLHKIGGTNIQLDLFEKVYIDALFKTGNYSLASNLLSERQSLRKKFSVGCTAALIQK